MKYIIRIILVLIIILGGIYAYTHYKTYISGKHAFNTAIPVSVHPVIEQDVTIPLRAIGNVQAYSTVAVKSLVDGQLLQVNFKGGDFVKKGQILFAIDPRTFFDQLNQAKATLAHDQAQLENAQFQVERNRSLLAKNYIAQQDFDQLIANQKAFAASVQSDQAAIDNANLQLSYATITSPIDGRTGSVQVDPGNIIKTANGTTLVTIIQINPVNVAFSIPQRFLASIQEQQAKAPVPVTARVGKRDEIGKLTFIDNTIDTTTGTIQLKATFDNADQHLWPGQFITVTLPTATLYHALLVPSNAVQVGQSGAFVYVVNADNTVSYQSVTLGPMVKNQTVILDGLKSKQLVVTSGQMRLTEGALVQIVGQSSTRQQPNTAVTPVKKSSAPT